MEKNITPIRTRFYDNLQTVKKRAERDKMLSYFYPSTNVEIAEKIPEKQSAARCGHFSSRRLLGRFPIVNIYLVRGVGNECFFFLVLDRCFWQLTGNGFAGWWRQGQDRFSNK